MYSAVSFVGDGHDHVDGGGEGNASDRVQEVRVDHLQNAFPNSKPEIKIAFLGTYLREIDYLICSIFQKRYVKCQRATSKEIQKHLTYYM